MDLTVYAQIVIMIYLQFYKIRSVNPVIIVVLIVLEKNFKIVHNAIKILVWIELQVYKRLTKNADV